MHRGKRVGERAITIQPEAEAEITIPVVIPPDTTVTVEKNAHPHLVPGLILSTGIAAIGTGVTLYLTSEKDTGRKLYYRETRPLGMGVALGGVAFTALGAILWHHASGDDDSAPVAHLDSHGGTIGWSHAF
jgi:hypothetical protein